MFYTYYVLFYSFFFIFLGKRQLRSCLPMRPIHQQFSTCVANSPLWRYITIDNYPWGGKHLPLSWILEIQHNLDRDITSKLRKFLWWSLHHGLFSFAIYYSFLCPMVCFPLLFLIRRIFGEGRNNSRNSTNLTNSSNYSLIQSSLSVLYEHQYD